MESIFWKTDEPLLTNSEVMNEYLESTNMLDITMVDGTYAEGVNCQGQKFEIHASGDGDEYHHRVDFKPIN